MAVRIKYVFAGGRRAKAAEVNANFSDVANAINTNENLISQNQLSISLLENNKASINGDSSNQFLVAEANNPLAAINLQQFKNLISPFMKIIYGYRFTLPSNSLVINISNGNCYDSSNTYILNYNGGTLNTTTLAATVQYYIYAVQDLSTTNPVSIEVSTSNISPVLPNQTTVYRLLGTLYKDTETHISKLTMTGARVMEDEINVTV